MQLQSIKIFLSYWFILSTAILLLTYFGATIIFLVMGRLNDNQTLFV